MSANNGFAIQVGPADANGRRLVTAALGERTHRDRFDTDNAYSRSKFIDRAISKLELTDDCHEHFDSKILAQAEAADTNGAVAECVSVRLSEVAPKKIEWLWPERIAIGKLTLIVGDPGLGKSFMCLDIASRITRGAGWPDNSMESQPAGDVILLTAEDALDDTVRPRCDALNGDVDRIVIIKGMKFADEADSQQRMVNLATDLGAIRKKIEAANQPRAIIIDPVSAYLGKTDSHKNAEVRAVLAPLSELAAELRIAVIAISHLRKGEGAALYRTMGSLAFIAAARSAWVVCSDAHDLNRSLMLPLKSNIARNVGGLAYAILPHGPEGAHVLCWDATRIDTLADDVIGKRHYGPEATERNEAREWLRAQLAAGSRGAKEVIDDGKDAGYSRRTLYRAFQELNAVSAIGGFPARAKWSLPAVPAAVPDQSTHGTTGTPGTTAKTPEEEEEKR